MIASLESKEQEAATRGARWLVLIHQIPPKPDYLRVKFRRRLRRIGAVALKNSVYVLPLLPEAMEDFQWLRREIVESGGDATLSACEFIEGVRDAELEELFRQERLDEYGEVIAAARVAAAEPTARAVTRLRGQLREVAARDYFGSPARASAEAAIAELEARLAGPAPQRTTPGVAGVEVGSVWVTRQGVFVDRIASAWLIARFIDPAARFKFVPAKGYRPAPSELRFDMFEGEFTHEADRCTFETLLDRFGIADAALTAIAEIVHDIDYKDDRFGREEVPGVRSLLEGLAAVHAEDDARLGAGRVLFDGLYEHFKRIG